MKAATLLVLLLAGQYRMRMVANEDRKVDQGRSIDGGYAWAVTCTNCSGGEEGGGGLTDEQLRATPVPVSGSLTCSGPITDAELRASAVPVSLASVPSHQVTGTFWQATQPVSGTLTCNAGSGTLAVSLASVPSHAVTGPLTDAQLRAVAVPVSGTFFQATQPVSIASMPSTPVTGTFFQATQPVSLATAPTTPVTGTFWQATQPVSGTFWQATQPVSGTFWQATQPVSGTVTANAGTGTLAVSGPVTDAQLRASAVPVSGPLTDAQLRAATVPVSGTVTANAGTGTLAVSGPITDAQARATALVVTEGSATRWSCFVPLTTTATTQCQAAPGASLRLYVTSITCSNGAATVQGVDIVHGTGSNCVTGLTALSHKFQMGTNGLTTSPFIVDAQFPTPIVPPQNVAICVRPTAATAFGCTLTGYTAQ